jgi:hypothetical protein
MYIVTIDTVNTIPRKRHFVCSAEPEFYPELHAYKVRGVETIEQGLKLKTALTLWTWGVLTDHIVVKGGFEVSKLSRTF